MVLSLILSLIINAFSVRHPDRPIAFGPKCQWCRSMKPLSSLESNIKKEIVINPVELLRKKSRKSANFNDKNKNKDERLI